MSESGNASFYTVDSVALHVKGKECSVGRVARNDAGECLAELFLYSTATELRTLADRLDEWTGALRALDAMTERW